MGSAAPVIVQRLTSSQRSPFLWLDHDLCPRSFDESMSSPSLAVPFVYYTHYCLYTALCEEKVDPPPPSSFSMLTKGQLFSKANFEVFMQTQIPTEIFLYFCPSL